MKKKDKGLDGKTWMNREVKRARSSFKNHQMKVIGPGHWRIRRPQDSCFWVDIVVMGDCGLAVWGDIGGLFFSYYSKPSRPEAVVYWMAKADVGYYGRQKARIGTGGPELVDEYVDDVAVYDLRQRLKWAKEEYGYGWTEARTKRNLWGNDEEYTPEGEYTEAIDTAIASIQQGENVQEVQRALYDDISKVEQDAYEWVFGIGKVPSGRLIYALTAVRRLGQLLRREDKKKEKAVA
jgi:hypothetical protein